MINPPRFKSLGEMDASQWQVNVYDNLENNIWPVECYRCRDTEQLNKSSIRLNALNFDAKQSKRDYLIVGGVLDNLCNSACQTCNETLSTKIGGLKGQVIRINNINKFWELPQERIVHLDINGGEPSYSPYYKEVLANLPPNVESIRLNTNCSTVLQELSPLIERGIKVIVTVSFDGIGSVHNYVRWPVSWDSFIKNLMTYKSMPIELNLWTTVSALNIGNLKDIFTFVKDNEFDHSWALLENPIPLNVKYKNYLTLNADVPDILTGIVASDIDNTTALNEYILEQDKIRNISIKDYII